MGSRGTSQRSPTCTGTCGGMRCRTGGRPARRRSWPGWARGRAAQVLGEPVGEAIVDAAPVTVRVEVPARGGVCAGVAAGAGPCGRAAAGGAG